MPTARLNPSGLLMPTKVSQFSKDMGAKDIIFSDDFLGSDTTWEKWGPAPTGGGNGNYDQKQVRVYNSLLSLGCRLNADGTYHSGGVGCHTAQTGARYECRIKINPTPGVDYCGILWPPESSPSWPVGGEWDFLEVNTEWDTSDTYTATYHYGADNSQEQMKVKYPSAGFWPGWHTYGTTWYPGEKVTLDIDDYKVGEIDGNFIVDTPQHLVLEVLQQGEPTQFSNMLCDWVVIYSI